MSEGRVSAPVASDLREGGVSGNPSLCQCPGCRMGRAVNRDNPDRAEMNKWLNAMTECFGSQEMDFAYLVGAVAEYVKAHDAPELVEALRIMAPSNLGIHHPDYEPPRRRSVVAAPSFVEGIARLAGTDLQGARGIARQVGLDLHLKPEADSAEGNKPDPSSSSFGEGEQTK